MASRDAFDNDGQNHHIGNTKHGHITGWFSKTPRVIIIAPTYIPRQHSTSTQQLVWLIWPKGNIENGKKGFANALDYLEAWDGSDSITAVKCSNRFETSCKMVA